MTHRILLDSFSGAASDLPPRQRTRDNVLMVLNKHPRVSTWDMSECRWLRRIINDLKREKLIEEDAGKEPYPWLRFMLTDAGRAALPLSAASAVRGET